MLIVKDFISKTRGFRKDLLHFFRLIAQYHALVCTATLQPRHRLSAADNVLLDTLHNNCSNIPMYRYQPLEHEDSFRLLVLHSSSDKTDPIVCTILHARLSDVTLEFKAISYTWGDNLNRQIINFRDHESELQIGQNCHTALCHLRQRHHDQLIWMDAICIDQENLEERSNQVRLMHRIYSRAVSVRVFLGEETEGSRLLFEELAEADRLLLQGAECDRPQPSEAIAQELDTLFRRPWFKRVWVLQEVWDKKSVVFMCGPASASSKALYKCTFAYVGELITQELCPMALSLAEGERDGDEEETSQLNLWTQLYWSRTCLATDPRDRIFALKSLLGHEQWKINYLIDYTKSVEEIYIMTAEFLWPVLKIRMLAASKHPHNMNMPSWCPDWSQNVPLDEIHMVNLLFNIAPDDDSSFLHIEDENGVCSFEDEESLPELHVKGTRYAQTVHKSQLFSFRDFNDAQRQMRELFVEVMTCEKVTPLYVEDHPVSSNQLGPHILKGR